jgi:hypothetical protein
MQLMNNALRIAKSMNADWFIYLDADEFIILNNAVNNIKDLLNYFNYADSLAVNWLMFGSNHLTTEPSGMILESYTKSEEKLADLVKCFVRPYKAINATNPHFFNMINPTRCLGTNNRIVPNSPTNKNNSKFSDTYAYIAHYVYQSEETFIKRKVLLPADDTGNFRGGNSTKEYASYIHNLYNDIENTYPKEKYVENIKKFLNISV